jgi:hypothetical protein
MPININGHIISSDSSNSSGIIQNYPNIVKSGLVLWLDAGRLTSYPATGTVWSDLTVNFYNATLLNGPSFSTAEYGGGSIKFVRASSTYASVYRVPDSFWNGGSWTVSAWVNFTSVNNGGDNAIVGHGVQGANNAIHLTERSGKAYFGLYANDITGAISLNAGTWYNLVWTYNNSGYLKQIYVNGTFDTSGGSVAYGGTGTNTELGRYPWSVASLLNGNIAIMCFYNKVLSANEVLQNFNADRSRFGV